MTRWLEAARAAKSAPDAHDKTDRTDKTPLGAVEGQVLSVLSVLQEGAGGEIAADPPAPAPTGEAVGNLPDIKRAPPAPETTAGRHTAANLPAAPPVCAVCGVADWTVSLTEPDGRRLHVACSGLMDPDGVARSPEAIEAVWDAAEAQAKRKGEP